MATQIRACWRKILVQSLILMSIAGAQNTLTVSPLHNRRGPAGERRASLLLTLQNPLQLLGGDLQFNASSRSIFLDGSFGSARTDAPPNLALPEPVFGFRTEYRRVTSCR